MTPTAGQYSKSSQQLAILDTTSFWSIVGPVLAQARQCIS
jgi:hypothetical protein